TTLASNVPAPKSYTTTADPMGTSRPSTWVKYVAAATGSATSRTLPNRAAAAASDSTNRRVAPHDAGQVSVVSAGGAPTVRRYSSPTRSSTDPMSWTTGTSRSPSRTLPSSMRRFGFGSNRAGSSRAECTASRPITSVPDGSAYTAEGSNGEPSNSS